MGLHGGGAGGIGGAGGKGRIMILYCIFVLLIVDDLVWP